MEKSSKTKTLFNIKLYAQNIILFKLHFPSYWPKLQVIGQKSSLHTKNILQN